MISAEIQLFRKCHVGKMYLYSSNLNLIIYPRIQSFVSCSSKFWQQQFLGTSRRCLRDASWFRWWSAPYWPSLFLHDKRCLVESVFLMLRNPDEIQMFHENFMRISRYFIWAARWDRAQLCADTAEINPTVRPGKWCRFSRHTMASED